MVSLLIFIGVMTTGCINNDIGITFDDKDNMIVTSSVKYADEHKEYLKAMDISPDRLKPLFEIKAKNLDVETQKEQYSGGYSGFKQTQICRNISKARDIREISILKPLEGKVNVLEIKNFLLFKKYILAGRILATSDFQQEMKDDIDLVLTTKFDIAIPTKAVKVKSNAWSVQGNHYLWEPKYLVHTPLQLEFCLLNWFLIVGTAVVLMFLVYFYLLRNRKISFNWRKTLAKIAKGLDDLSQQAETKNEEIVASNNKTTQNINPIPAKPNFKPIPKEKAQTKIILLIAIPVLAVTLGLGFYFSIPKICETLINNSVQSIYVNDTEKAIQLIEIAKLLSPDEDFSKDIYSKGIDEFNKNNMSNAEAFMQMTLKLGSKQAKDFSKELTNKSISALKSKHYAKAKKLMEYALKFDDEKPQNKKDEINKKCENLTLAYDYNGALACTELLIVLNPKDEEVYTHKGQILFNLNRVKESIDAYTKAINIRNNYATAYFWRAKTYLDKTKEYDKAIYDYKKVIELSKNHNEIAYAHYNLGIAYYNKKSYSLAINESLIASEMFYNLGNGKMEDQSMALYHMAARFVFPDNY